MHLTRKAGTERSNRLWTAWACMVAATNTFTCFKGTDIAACALELAGNGWFLIRRAFLILIWRSSWPMHQHFHLRNPRPSLARHSCETAVVLPGRGQQYPHAHICAHTHTHSLHCYRRHTCRATGTWHERLGFVWFSDSLPWPLMLSAPRLLLQQLNSRLISEVFGAEITGLNVMV